MPHDSTSYVHTREQGTWRPWHTAALILLTAFCVGMAIWRPLGIYSSWITVMVTILLFIMVAGHGIKGVWRGALIDERNKMSLSRFQMLTWTIVVLAAFGTIAIARALVDPITSMDIAVPPTVWLLMGISTTSLLGSPLIMNSKKSAPEPPKANETLAEQGADPKSLRVEGRVIANTSVRDARWADLFTGEEVANVTHLDLAKIQMFFFTVLTVLAYAVAIGVSLRGDTIPSSLPEVGDGMLTLLGISHGGYLAGKALPPPDPKGPKREGG